MGSYVSVRTCNALTEQCGMTSLHASFGTGAVYCRALRISLVYAGSWWQRLAPTWERRMTSACALRLCFSLRASSFCFSITARRASHSPASASASASLSLSRTSLCSDHAFNITMLYLMVPPVMHESMQLHEYQTQMDLLASFMEGKEEHTWKETALPPTLEEPGLQQLQHQWAQELVLRLLLRGCLWEQLCCRLAPAALRSSCGTWVGGLQAGRCCLWWG